MKSSKEQQELWLAFQSGNKEALGQLYALHIRELFRYGLHAVSISEEFVLDCIHDLFIDLWVKRTQITTPENIKAYLFKALRNRILNNLKKDRQSSGCLDITDYEFLTETEEPDFELFDLKEEKGKTLKSAIELLPPKQQEVIKLRFVEELNYIEIARILDIKTQTAQNLAMRAIAKLRQLLIRDK